VNRKKKYPPEFISEAVKLVKKRGRSLNSVARELGVPQTTLWVWVNGREPLPAEPSIGTRSVESLTVEEKDAELRKLRSEVAMLREEKDILKKAAAFFAKEST
jgi:transposase